MQSIDVVFSPNGTQEHVQVEITTTGKGGGGGGHFALVNIHDKKLFPLLSLLNVLNYFEEQKQGDNKK